jgi:hypothetical protein
MENPFAQHNGRKKDKKEEEEEDMFILSVCV